jgi:hypothetical protein
MRREGQTSTCFFPSDLKSNYAVTFSDPFVKVVRVILVSLV